jgi:hypothetical protein
MPVQISLLSLVASYLYGAVTLSCCWALAAAFTTRQQRWHIFAWTALTGLFVLLMVMRFYDVEEVLRSTLREAMRAQQSYDSRREFQRPLVALLVAVAGLGGFAWIALTIRAMRGRRNLATAFAVSCGGAMLLLVTLRIVSLHPIDRLLYGPVKLNWVADIGLSLAVLCTALIYAGIVRRSTA